MSDYGSMFRLDGRVAVVTGASRNIGAAIADAFAVAGAQLLLVARGEDELATRADLIREHTGARVATLVADITAPSTPAAVVDAARAEFDEPITVLVNNAFSSGDTTSTVFDVDESVWDMVLQTNLLGPMRMAQTIGRTMLDVGHGSIINLLSGSGFLPTPKLAAYGTSKAALWMLTRYLALEGAPDVRANAICPGVVTESGLPRSDSQRLLLEQVPMKRMGHPSEIAGAAVYLASDAASYTTGEVIFVNGGRPW